jgi:hypothetical protein
MISSILLVTARAITPRILLHYCTRYFSSGFLLKMTRESSYILGLEKDHVDCSIILEIMEVYNIRTGVTRGSTQMLYVNQWRGLS